MAGCGRFEEKIIPTFFAIDLIKKKKLSVHSLFKIVLLL